MSKRMMVLLAILLGAGALIVLDKPQDGGMVEVSRPAERAARASMPAVQASVPQSAGGGDSIPDLFAAPGAPSAPPVVDQVAVGGDGEPAVAPFVLLGFKEEDGVREAYLLRNGEVVLARAGAVLEKRYRVQALQQESVQMKDNKSGEEIRVGFGVGQ